MIYSLAILFFYSLLSIPAKGLLITHSMVNILQKFGYGVQVKRKEKYLYNVM